MKDDMKNKEAAPNAFESNFISSLSRTLAAANAYLMEQLKQAGLVGIVPSHGDILAQLFANDVMTMQGLSDRIGRDPSTVTCLVKKLVDQGYVRAQKSVEDKRRTEVSLTKKGQRLRGEFENISRELVNAQMTGISSRDFDITCKTLAKIKANFESARGAAK